MADIDAPLAWRMQQDGYLMQINQLRDENAKLRELLQRLHKEYQYMRARPRQMYLQHEQRMRSIEDEMRELGIEVTP